jgi:endo-1,4-beta-xylanase
MLTSKNITGIHSIIFLTILFTGIFSSSLLTFAQPLAHNKDKFVGNVIRNGNQIEAIFDDYWNQVTPENAGKWGSVEPVQDTYNWTQLDNIYNYASLILSLRIIL